MNDDISKLPLFDSECFATAFLPDLVSLKLFLELSQLTCHHQIDDESPILSLPVRSRLLSFLLGTTLTL